MINENKDITEFNANIRDNQFSYKNKLYLVSNPSYYYLKNSFFRKILGRKITLIYRENEELPINLKQSDISNQLDKHVRDDLYFSKIVRDYIGGKSDILNYLMYIMIIGCFIGGYIIGKIG